ncbi:MAG: glycoside hydrolase family 13 protein [Candidatus Bathyarchaeota archaeon]|nr:glycoside hydrolase family 13 protein [Candidatus Bathyarchaeota archaeon]
METERGEMMQFSKYLALILIFLSLLSPLILPVVEEVQSRKAFNNITDDLSFKTPDWVKDAIFYQIYPDRFRDGDSSNNAMASDVVYEFENLYAQPQSWGETPGWDNAWFGGDLKGVQEEIPYLVDLGITAIYFNPIMDSTISSGYAPIDYKSVNRYFGVNHRGPNNELILDYGVSLEVFKDLMAALNKYEIKVILDGVFNHCSPKNKWFDRDHDFPTDGAYENQSSLWYSRFHFTHWPNNYDCWGGYSTLPEVQEVDGFEDYVYRSSDSVIKFWDDLDVDGWRLDSANLVSHEFWQEFRTHYKQLNPEGYLVGEYWPNSFAYLQGDQWDSTTNYVFRDAVLDWAKGESVNTFSNRLMSIKNSYPAEAFYTCFNLLGSHDTSRPLTVLGNNKARMKLAVIFQMTYPGAPVIYYGDEVGMTGETLAEARGYYPWPDLGFQPDLNMLNHYKRLITIRRIYPVLRTGTLETRVVDDYRKIYVLARRLNSSVAIVAYNNGGANQTVTIDVGDLLGDGVTLTDVLNDKTYIVSGGKVTVDTKGLWANILINRSASVVCNSTGSPREHFHPDDPVYFGGNGFSANREVRLYVTTNRSYLYGYPITDVRRNDYSLIMTGSNGSIPVTYLEVAGNLSAQELPAYYDIVVDTDCDGLFDPRLDIVNGFAVTITQEGMPSGDMLSRDIAILATCLIAICSIIIIMAKRKDVEEPKFFLAKIRENVNIGDQLVNLRIMCDG